MEKINKICILFAIILCMALLVLVRLTLSQELEIELKPIYFSKGYPVTYTPDIEVSGIQFEIIAKNNNLTSRILDLVVLDSNINFPNETKGLRIFQKKSLWTSDLLEVNQSNSTYFVKIFGFNEKSDETVYANDTISIIIESAESNSFLNEVGESIYPSNPKVGLYVGGVVVLCMGFVLWKYELSNYFERKSAEWKENEAQKRRENYEDEEGW